MFRIEALALVAFAGASRIQVHEVDRAEKTQWGASCEDLQENFRGRITSFRAAFDAIEDWETASSYTSARMMMRTYGLIRTMRRAEDCSWVTDDSSEDMEDLRGAVSSLLAGNPCAEVAASQMNADTTDDSADDEIQSIQRALWALTSEDCSTNVPVEEMEGVNGDNVAERVRDAEDALVDGIEQLEAEGEPSLIQTDSRFIGRIFRAIGIAILLMFFAMACWGTVALLGVGLGVLAFSLTTWATPEAALLGWILYPTVGFYAGATLGLLGCMYRTLAILLPQLAR